MFCLLATLKTWTFVVWTRVPCVPCDQLYIYTFDPKGKTSPRPLPTKHNVFELPFFLKVNRTSGLVGLGGKQRYHLSWTIPHVGSTQPFGHSVPTRFPGEGKVVELCRVFSHETLPAHVRASASRHQQQCGQGRKHFQKCSPSFLTNWSFEREIKDVCAQKASIVQRFICLIWRTYFYTLRSRKFIGYIGLYTF